MSKGKESGGHPGRYDLSGKRYATISTCGLYTLQGNYGEVNAQFDRIYGKDGYISVYYEEGKLFRALALRERVDKCLSWVRRAGKELAVSFISPASDSVPFAAGPISSATQELLTQSLVPRDTFEEMAGADWGVREECIDWAERGEQNGVQPDPSLNFTHQMVTFYNKEVRGDRDRTGYRCQLIIPSTTSRADRSGKIPCFCAPTASLPPVGKLCIWWPRYGRIFCC